MEYAITKNRVKRISKNKQYEADMKMEISYLGHVKSRIKPME
jgi:hypothetical protein